MSFRAAIELTPALHGAYRNGLQALRAEHRSKVTARQPKSLSGSIDLDSALRGVLPNDPRWDYGVGVASSSNESVHWIEVHPASHSGVGDMLAKLRWLRAWLGSNAPTLGGMSAQFHWVATDATISITPGSKQARQLAAEGISGPKRVLAL